MLCFDLLSHFKYIDLKLGVIVTDTGFILTNCTTALCTFFFWPFGVNAGQNIS